MSSTSATQRPLRLGIIGLSAHAVTSWASGAHLPALLSEHGQKSYTIAALCNSSVPAAEDAIKKYNLSPNTKAYGSPDDLANDPDIDVVICITRVDKHYETALPSIQKGKSVYIEWPIAASQAQIDEIVRTADKTGARVAIGLQGPWAPPILKVKEIIEGGSVGKVLSSNVKAHGGANSRDILPIGLKYFAQKEVGGNPITIGFMHMTDFVLSAMGNLVPGTTHARTQIQRPGVRIRDPQSGEIVDTVRSTVPDLIVLHGEIGASDKVAQGASLSIHYRTGQHFPTQPAFEWTVNCEKGEIRLVGPAGSSLQAASYSTPPTIQIHHFVDDKLEDVEWSWSEEQEALPTPARVVSQCLYAFAAGDSKGYTSLEHAALRAKQIDAWVERGAW